MFYVEVKPTSTSQKSAPQYAVDVAQKNSEEDADGQRHLLRPNNVHTCSLSDFLVLVDGLQAEAQKRATYPRGQANCKQHEEQDDIARICGCA